MTDLETLPAKPRRHPDTAFRKIGDDGGLVVLPGRAEVKVLNPVGIVVFSLLDGTRDLNALKEAVMAEFEIDETEAREGVVSFLHDLQREGMLET
ncbi:MAG TPA: PqqD family protein [Candidatus Polarisedimenticolaceae bacterium]|nr:PqqD family protein [Candidatus Polarisedimenticolaceae bacterium]